jgi:hypothetical protein
VDAILWVDGVTVTPSSQTDSTLVFLAPAHAVGTVLVEVSAGAVSSNKVSLHYADPNGPLEVLQLAAVPNPNPSSVAVQLGGPADGISLKLYTTAMVLIRALNAPGSPAGGWVRVALPADWTHGLANGTYYLEVEALQGARRSPVKVTRVVLIR